jgi:hypothetical protein
VLVKQQWDHHLTAETAVVGSVKNLSHFCL